MKLLVTGATGLLGGWLVDELTRRGDTCVALGGPARERGIDLTDEARVADAVSNVDAVIHTAALSAIADCARDPKRAAALNVAATRNVARACVASGARLVHVSTDLVFDGEHAPYAEDASPAPTSVYGRTKLEAEGEALAVANSVVARVSLLFGPTRNTRVGFFDQQVKALRDGAPLRLFDDEWRTPLSLRVAAEGLRAIAGSTCTGVLHFAGIERLSRWEMGEQLAAALGVHAPELVRTSRNDAPGEPRPRDVSLDVSRFRALFPEVALRSFRDECTFLLT